MKYARLWPQQWILPGGWTIDVERSRRRRWKTTARWWHWEQQVEDIGQLLIGALGVGERIHCSFLDEQGVFSVMGYMSIFRAADFDGGLEIRSSQFGGVAGSAKFRRTSSGSY